MRPIPTTEANGFLFLSGATALDEEGRVVAPGDVAGQASYILERIGVTLAEHGATPQDVLKMTSYYLDASGMTAMRPIRRDFFAPVMPASTGVVVSGLLVPGLLLEIEVMAKLPAA